MSEHTKYVLTLGLTLIFGLPSVAFFAWMAWSLFWDLYDHLMQQRTRRRMNKLQPRSGRDCFRDMKGITR